MLVVCGDCMHMSTCVCVCVYYVCVCVCITYVFVCVYVCVPSGMSSCYVASVCLSLDMQNTCTHTHTVLKLAF